LKTEEIRVLSVPALGEHVNDAKEELMRLRFQKATGELTDYSRMRITRRKIARLYTILKEQQAAASGGTEHRTEGEK
jgi:large subunit ribosomal protein L29